MSNLNTDEQRDTLLVLSHMNAHISLLGWTTTESSRTKLAVLVLSLIPDIAYIPTVPGATAGQTVMLMVMHVVAAVVIVGMLTALNGEERR